MAKTEKRTRAAKKSFSGRSDKQSNPVSRYLRETRGELRKVTWPTREESWRLTLIVLGVSLVMAAFLWAFDTMFSSAIRFLIELIVGV